MHGNADPRRATAGGRVAPSLAARDLTTSWSSTAGWRAWRSLGCSSWPEGSRRVRWLTPGASPGITGWVAGAVPRG